jgi:hypothetical protein
MKRILFIFNTIVVLCFLSLVACSSTEAPPPDGDGFVDGDLDGDADLEPECLDIPIVDVNQTWPVVPTGQTTCYANSGEIPCPAEGEPFYGQDAQYPDNERAFNEYELSGDAVVEDSLTGLMWAKDFAEELTWLEARGYCETLDYAGFDDWRLPNMHELRSLATYSGVSPTSEFPGMVAENFWSSTLLAGVIPPDVDNNKLKSDQLPSHFLTVDSSRSTCDEDLAALGIGFFGAFHFNDPISYPTNVICTRLDPVNVLHDHTTRFTITEPTSGEMIVADGVTGLKWPQNIKDDVCWQEALTYCGNLEFGGYSDWRLPNINELASLLNYGKYNPASDFPDLPSKSLWSSTSLLGIRAWFLNTGYPRQTDEPKIQDEEFGYCSFSALCVRGGP